MDNISFRKIKLNDIDDFIQASLETDDRLTELKNEWMDLIHNKLKEKNRGSSEYSRAHLALQLFLSLHIVSLSLLEDLFSQVRDGCPRLKDLTITNFLFYSLERQLDVDSMLEAEGGEDKQEEEVLDILTN